MKRTGKKKGPDLWLSPTDAGMVVVMSNGHLDVIECCFSEGKGSAREYVYKIGGLRYGGNGKQLDGCEVRVARVLNVFKVYSALERVDQWFKSRTKGFQQRCSLKVFKEVAEALK